MNQKQLHIIGRKEIQEETEDGFSLVRIFPKGVKEFWLEISDKEEKSIFVLKAKSKNDERFIYLGNEYFNQLSKGGSILVDDLILSFSKGVSS